MGFGKLCASLCLVLALGSASWAQEARGRIIGRVTDGSGGVIPQTEVRITNIATGVTMQAMTNEQGNYIAPFLVPGTYKLSVERAGFKGFVQDNIELRVDDRLEINVMLEVGAVADTVTVTEQTPLLETTSASMGQVVDARRVAELPMAHGVPFHLIKLAPGASFAGPHARFDQPYAPSYMAAYAMDGTRASRSDLTIDGVPNTATNGRLEVTSSYVPPADIVAEFKVQTASFDATVGQTEGGIVNVSLKSGTNTLHGALNYMKMHPALDAASFFTNKARQQKPDYDYNRFGVSATGPIRIPGLYDGRNKTFFMYGYEGILTTTPRGTTLTVPTAKEREGDFSEFLRLGSRYQIFDPATRRSIGSGRFQSDPFPGNIIPASRISPIARNILKYYPMPTAEGTADHNDNLPLPTKTEDLTYNTHTFRGDHNLSDRHRIFARVNGYLRDSNHSNWFGNAATGLWETMLSRGAALDDVYTFSPTFVLNARYGYNRFVRGNTSNPESEGFDLTSLGFPASYHNAIDPAFRTFPQIVVTGYASTGNGGYIAGAMETHTFNAGFDKVAGEHSLKFGGEFRAYRENRYSMPVSTSGRLEFSTNYTKGPRDTDPASPKGQGLASLLLGIPTSGYFQRQASFAEQSTVWSLYFQDDWKVTRKLNITLGVRYELEGPLTERFNRSIRGFDPNASIAIADQARAAYARAPIPELPVSAFQVRGGVEFAGINGVPRELFQRDANNIMPRIGFAYTLTPKTVLRGGYGEYYGFLGQRRGDVLQNGFSYATPIVPSLDGGLTFVSTLANPFPNGITEAPGSSLGPMTDIGQGVTVFNTAPLAPRQQRWQFGIQRELPGRLTTEISYVGNRGTDIETNRSLKILPQQYLSTSPVRDQKVIDFLSENVANPFAGLLPGTGRNGALISRSSLLQPNPHFTGLDTTTNEGYSSYHSLQTRVEKRFAQGYTIQFGHTWSKFMEAITFLNEADQFPERVIGEQDFPHRIAGSGIYELPFGKGRRWLGHGPGVLNAVAGGWQVQGIYTWQTGRALGFGNSIFYGNLKDIPLPRGERTADRWFNTNAGFERDTRYQLSHNVRRFSSRFSGIRGDEMNNWDISIIKYTQITEQMKLQFRAEFLNTFNTVNFVNPNTSPTSTAFGTINNEQALPRRIQLGLKLVF